MFKFRSVYDTNLTDFSPETILLSFFCILTTSSSQDISEEEGKDVDFRRFRRCEGNTRTKAARRGPKYGEWRSVRWTVLPTF